MAGSCDNLFSGWDGTRCRVYERVHACKPGTSACFGASDNTTQLCTQLASPVGAIVSECDAECQRPNSCAALQAAANVARSDLCFTSGQRRCGAGYRCGANATCEAVPDTLSLFAFDLQNSQTPNFVQLGRALDTFAMQHQAKVSGTPTHSALSPSNKPSGLSNAEAARWYEIGVTVLPTSGNRRRATTPAGMRVESAISSAPQTLANGAWLVANSVVPQLTTNNGGTTTTTTTAASATATTATTKPSSSTKPTATAKTTTTKSGQTPGTGTTASVSSTNATPGGATSTNNGTPGTTVSGGGVSTSGNPNTASSSAPVGGTGQTTLSDASSSSVSATNTDIISTPTATESISTADGVNNSAPVENDDGWILWVIIAAAALGCCILIVIVVVAIMKIRDEPEEFATPVDDVDLSYFEEADDDDKESDYQANPPAASDIYASAPMIDDLDDSF